MFTLMKARTAAFARQALLRPTVCALLSITLGACTNATVLPDGPANSSRQAPPVVYRPALSGYTSARPVEPKPWREQNDAVAPKERSQ